MVASWVELVGWLADGGCGCDSAPVFATKVNKGHETRTVREGEKETRTMMPMDMDRWMDR